MTGWDFVTWLSAFVLGTSALVIFSFFLRDARSILVRELHPPADEQGSASESAAGGAQSAPPEDPALE